MMGGIYMRRIIVIVALIALLLQGCAPTAQTASTTSCGGTACIAGSNATSAVEKVEVYHFHGTAQCYSCKTVGAYAEETVNLFYADEVRSGKVIFQSINYDLPENRELATNPEQNTDVWLKINNKDDYLLYLKSVIGKRLAGDFS
jgi:hypothetical protein